jgi:hypothetical protein
MAPGSLRQKYTSKEVLTCRPCQFIRHPLPRIRAAPRCTPRRNLGVVLALIQIQRCLTPGPNLPRGCIRAIIRRETPTLLVPHNSRHLHGVPTWGTKWFWISRLKGRNQTCPLTITKIYLRHLSCSSRCRPYLYRFSNNSRSPRPDRRLPLLSPQGLARTCGRRKIKI